MPQDKAIQPKRLYMIRSVIKNFRIRIRSRRGAQAHHIRVILRVIHRVAIQAQAHHLHHVIN